MGVAEGKKESPIEKTDRLRAEGRTAGLTGQMVLERFLDFDYYTGWRSGAERFLREGDSQ